MKIEFEITRPDMIEQILDMAEKMGRTPSEQVQAMTEEVLTPKELAPEWANDPAQAGLSTP